MINKVWFHFIGGYYKSVEKFLTEAKRLGITRRIPVQIARGMNFGDKIILLRWKHKCAMAFAEMIVTNIVLDEGISEQVCQKLAEKGKVKPLRGIGEIKPTTIIRECGSYISAKPVVPISDYKKA